MKNLSILIFLLLILSTSVKSQNYFQVGFSIGGGYNFNRMQEVEISPYKTKSIIVFSYYFDISYRMSKNLFFETDIGNMLISSFIERDLSKIGTNNLYTNNENGQTVPSIPIYINYTLLNIKNKYSLRGIIGVNNLLPFEFISNQSSMTTPTSTLFDTSVSGIHSGYYFCLVGGLVFEKQYTRGNRLGLKLIYQQGFREIGYQEMHYSYNSQSYDKTARSYNNGSQVNLCIYYYWGPLGKKYRIIKAPKTGNDGLTQ
jgi:hypothetical protein